MCSDCGAEEVSRVHMTSLNKMGCYSNSGSSFCQMKGPAAPHQSSPHSLKQSRKPKLYFICSLSTLNSSHSREAEKECLINYTWPIAAQWNVWEGGGAGGLFGYVHSSVNHFKTISSDCGHKAWREPNWTRKDLWYLLVIVKAMATEIHQHANCLVNFDPPDFSASFSLQTSATLPKQKSKTVMLTSVHVASEGELESLFYFRCCTFTLIFTEFSLPVSLQQNPGDTGYFQ